jgi:hypothetical protein
MLGYPEQALKMTDAAHGHARRRGHPFNLSHALTAGAQVFDFLGEPDELLKRVAEADLVGRENSLPFMTECLVPLYSGIALIGKGQAAEGVALLKRVFAVWEGGGNRVSSPYYKSVVAEGLASSGISMGRSISSTRPSRRPSGQAGKSAGTMPKPSASRAGYFL